MEQHKKVVYKFKEFTTEVDMEAPMFKTCMFLFGMAEFRKALIAHIVNERVNIGRSRNEATILDAHCDEDFPWMIKVAQNGRTEEIVVRKYYSGHTCERYWELKTLTTPFLTQAFIYEFRDNRKMEL
jgi:hypothetical protein